MWKKNYQRFRHPRGSWSVHNCQLAFLPIWIAIFFLFLLFWWFGFRFWSPLIHEGFHWSHYYCLRTWGSWFDEGIVTPSSFFIIFIFRLFKFNYGILFFVGSEIEFILCEIRNWPYCLQLRCRRAVFTKLYVKARLQLIKFTFFFSWKQMKSKLRM